MGGESSVGEMVKRLLNAMQSIGLEVDEEDVLHVVEALRD
jgi:hypothetical protein